MKIVKLIQGTPEWHAHRAAHFNASDAPAMLGVSPYKTRQQLLREYATGITPDVDAETQRRFDDGHRLEALARPEAERIIGEDLYPCVGVEGQYSASFDGITLLQDTAFEHKMSNAELWESVFRANALNEELPVLYRAQMEQQCMVSGAERVLFMVSKRIEDGIERRSCWYSPDPDLRARIVAGWAQFAADLEALREQPEATPAPAPAAVGRAPESLPALRIEVTGMVTASNLAEFRDRAVSIFRSIRSDLKTDQDFADAEQTVKWCGEIEDKLKLAKDAALSQTESIEKLFRTIDEIGAEARAKRLELEKLVKARKEAVRAEIVNEAAAGVRAHVATINATLGEHAIGFAASAITAEIGAAIKGRKTIASITDAAQTAAANAKIAASQQAERVRACIAVLAEHGAGYEHMFPDRVSLCAAKSPDDLRNLVTSRIAEQQQREAAAKAEAQATLERARAAASITDTAEVVAATPTAPAPPAPATEQNAPMLRIGEINARIAPLSITAEGIGSLGFMPAEIHGATKFYRASDFHALCVAMIGKLQAAAARR